MTGSETEEPKAKKQQVSKGSEKPEADDSKENASGNSPPSVEEGTIYFLYRPRVGFEEVKSVSDIQRFYMVLSPEKGSNSGKKHRLVVIGKKKIPAQKERFFGFVQSVSDEASSLTQGMGEESHETAGGTRHTEASRIAGQGKYLIVNKDGSGTHLTYKLEIPSKPGKVQEELSIGDGGSLAISIKNPKKANPGRNVGLDNKADYGELQKLFDGTPGGYAWIAVKDGALLDHQNCEILLIGANPDIKKSLGDGVEKNLEEKVEEDKEQKTDNADEDEEEQLLDAMKKELKADKVGLEETPTIEKKWK